MSANPKVRMTREEYLAFERASDTKHEYWDGVIYDMAGADRNHVRVVRNIISQLHTQLLGRPCEPFSNDLRVRVGTKNAYVYPDVVVACGTPQFDDDQFDTLLNPILIVEVLSDSTDRHDRVTKLQAYRNLPTMRDYLLVSQNGVFVEHYSYQNEKWGYDTYGALDDMIALDSIGATLALSDVYARVEFPPDEA